MGEIKAFKIEDEEYIAKELTVKQVDRILDAEAPGEKELGIIELLFPDRMPSIAIAMSLGITREDLGAKDFSPSELAKIMDKVEGVNPIFANLVQRLAKLGRAIAEKSAGQSAS